jgi:DNA replication protein DnaC
VTSGKAKLEEASIKEACKRLHLPTIAGQCVRLSEQAVKEKQSHLTYLDALLEAEVEERERNVVKRRLKEAHFPKVKTLEDFDFEASAPTHRF